MPSRLPEGRFAIVTDVRRDAVDADALADERRGGGRRSRVVLTPRRRRQVSRKCPRGDGDKKARSPGRSRRKPLKPLRRECRVFSGVTAVTNARVYYKPRAAGGAPGARHSLRPLKRGRDVFRQNSRARAARSRNCVRLRAYVTFVVPAN